MKASCVSAQTILALLALNPHHNLDNLELFLRCNPKCFSH